LSKLRQISTKFDNFWHTDSQNDCPPHLVYINALRRKTQMLKLIHYAVTISVRLLIFSLSIRQKMPRDLIILWY